MYKIDFHNPIHVHFIGIGGISMSGLAEILLKENFTISGSDANTSPLTDRLGHLGASIFDNHSATNINKTIDLVVYTAAIGADNEELLAAKKHQIPLLSRAQLLGQLMINYKLPIAVSGTHGKTTTTSMLSHILLEHNSDPTVSVGGILNVIGGNIRVGKSDYFLTEACEYTNSFLHFFPKISIILNIEADHLDFFKDIYEIRESFTRFANLLPSDGLLVINDGIENYEEITKNLSCKIITYGTSSTSDYFADDISYDHLGHPTFQVMKNHLPYIKVSLHVGGDHNISNALASIAVSDYLNIPADSIQNGLFSFTGTNRRFEYKGQKNGITVIDDYAHHPTEIRATLQAAMRYPHKDLWCVFQPHTYTRTKALFPNFVDALSSVSHVILTDIYAAREKNTFDISSKDLADALEKTGCDVHYFSSFDAIEEFLIKNCKKEDLLITMGAGNVVNIGENFLKL